VITAKDYADAFVALAPLVLIAGGCFAVFVRWRIGHHCARFLNTLLINLVLPAFIASHVLGTFDPSKLDHWPAYPLLFVFFLAASAFIASLFSVGRSLRRERLEFTACTTFRNYAFLPLAYLVALPLGEALRDQLLNGLFLFALPGGIILCTLGMYLMTGGRARRSKWTEVFGPPLVTTLVCVAAVLIHRGPFQPSGPGAIMLRALDLVARCAVPLVMIATGAELACNIPGRPLRWGPMLRTGVAAGVVAPVIVVLLARHVMPGQIMGPLLILQATAPPALGLLSMAKRHKWGENLTRHILFFCYVAGIFTAPFWLAFLLHGAGTS